MLNHLHIQNYRLFRDLHIDKLGQINLIAGKNNTGKTALLEALRILQNKMSFEIISNIVHIRKDLNKSKPFESLATLFGESKKSQIQSTPYDELTFKINDLYWGILKFDGGRIKQHFGPHGQQMSMAGEIGEFFNYENPNDETVYVAFNSNLQTKSQSGFWEKIEFDEVEKKKVVDMLNIISSKKIQQVSMSNEITRIQLTDGTVEKLTKSGDGANRLFALALALVNAKNKMLLIDEFEVGLHHSVQEQLWDIIFKYAKEWNIQVFVTTHSQDTLRAFYYVAEKTLEYKEMANYFTLSRKGDGDVKVINYDLEDIETSILANLEIR